MSDSGYNLSSTWQSLVRWWHDFFHCPRDVRVCALIRIAYAALVLVHLAVLYPDLALWFSDGGVIPVEVARQTAGPYHWSLLWHLPATPDVIQTCFWIAVAHAVLLSIGLVSRLNAACVLVWLISFQSRNLLILDAEDVVMRLLALYLVLMPCGACWSLDAAIGRWWRG